MRGERGSWRNGSEDTQLFPENVGDSLCVLGGGWLGRGRDPSPTQMTQTFSPSAPQDTLCLPLGLYTPPFSRVFVLKGHAEESGRRQRLEGL